jgi:hypothetical protein
MVQTNYRNKMNSILVPEMIGALVCLVGVVFIAVSLQAEPLPGRHFDADRTSCSGQAHWRRGLI